MDYAQERVTTLHDLAGATPDAPTGQAAVIVPMTEREYGGLAAERVLSALEAVAPGRVIVALRAGEDRIGAFREWLASFDLPLDVLWCNGPELERLLEERGFDGEAGKGRDVWLALGAAATHEYVAIHDADAKTASADDVARLLFPLAEGYEFSKGYYARVENGRLYGRLCRLFYNPLVSALAADHDDDLLDYLGAFRYALAGEFALSASLARRLPVEPRWGLEVGTLGSAYDYAGFDGTAQVDLGRHEHDHRSVSGPTGLSDMSDHVADALFRTLESAGIEPAYDTLPERYRRRARSFVERYAADAGFNGLAYDRRNERDQIDVYAASITPPSEDSRLPAWHDASLSPSAVEAAARADLAAADDAKR